MNFRLTILLLLWLFLGTAFAGDTGVGNPGTDDRLHGFDAAWFLGPEKTINVCYEASPTFKGAGKIIGAIENAFQVWGKYIALKKIDTALMNAAEFQWSINHQGKPTSDAEFRALIPTVKIHLVACDSTEQGQSRVDLKILFGKKDKTVEKALSHYTNPKAFAERQSYSLKEGWGKGYIFVAETDTITGLPIDWDLATTLNGILVHEVGHVLGVNHIEGTIMDDRRLANEIDSVNKNKSKSKTNPVFNHIDGSRELYICSECAFEFNGKYVADDIKNMDSILKPLKTLMGRSIEGSTLYVKVKQDGNLGTLSLWDVLGKIDLPYTLEFKPFQFFGGTKIFNVRNSQYDDIFVGGGNGNNQNGEIKTKDGVSFRMTLARNPAPEDGGSKLLLLYLVNGTEQTPFFMWPFRVGNFSQFFFKH